MAKKEKNSNLLVPLRLASLADLARLAYNFNFTSDNVFLGQDKGRRTAYAFGEKLDGKTLMYTLEVENQGRFLTYRPPENGYGEEAAFAQEFVQGRQPINVLGMKVDSLGIVRNSGKLKLRAVELDGLEDMIKLAIKTGSDDEGLACLYCFKDNDSYVLYGIDLLGNLHDGDSIIYHARIETGKGFGFALYDYKEGRAALTDSVGEHSYMYLKIINLAERPGFFKGKI